MDLLSIILLAIGLAMDCFAVSIAKGMVCKSFAVSFRQPTYLLMALLFGLFQGGMPLIGYYAGSIFASFFERFAPVVALILLAIIGGRMIWESLHESKEESTADWCIRTLLILAVATSIDALSIGVIFIPVPEVLWPAISIIAFTSFAFTIVGYAIGALCGKHFKLNVGLIGGIILVAIGLKIFIEGMI